MKIKIVLISKLQPNKTSMIFSMNNLSNKFANLKFESKLLQTNKYMKEFTVLFPFP